MQGSIMSARKIQDEKAIAREMFVQQAAHANAEVSASPTRGDTICPTKSKREDTLESTTEEEIQPLPTGEYRLRVKGGEEYLVTRTYKDSLRDLAQLWVGSERLPG